MCAYLGTVKAEQVPLIST